MFARRKATQNGSVSRVFVFFLFTLTPCFTLMQLHIFTPPSFLVRHSLKRNWLLGGGEGVSASWTPWFFLGGLSASHLWWLLGQNVCVIHFTHLHLYSAPENWNLWPSSCNWNFYNLYITLGCRTYALLYIAKPPHIAWAWLQFTIPINFICNCMTY